jgi:hypothetical protein
MMSGGGVARDIAGVRAWSRRQEARSIDAQAPKAPGAKNEGIRACQGTSLWFQREEPLMALPARLFCRWVVVQRERM